MLNERYGVFNFVDVTWIVLTYMLKKKKKKSYGMYEKPFLTMRMIKTINSPKHVFMAREMSVL